MKKSDIVLGGIYANKQGQQRKVVAVGPQYKRMVGQVETDNLRYEVAKRSTFSRQSIGTQANETRASFAAWARVWVNYQEVSQ